MLKKLRLAGIIILALVFIYLLFFYNTKSSANSKTSDASSSEAETDSVKYETNLGNIYDNLCKVAQENNLQWEISDVEKSKPKGSNITNYYININDFKITYTGFAGEDYTIDIDTNKYMDFSANMPYLIMAFDDSCPLEKAKEISTSLIDTYDENSSSDVAELSGYCVYLKPDSFEAAYGDSVINAVFSPYKETVKNINPADFSELTIDQMLNSIYEGQNAKVTATVTSASKAGQVDSYSFEAVTDAGDAISFLYTMSEVPCKFKAGEKYTFYGTVRKTVSGQKPSLFLTAAEAAE